MNITEQDCRNGREAVRRDGVIVKLTGWKRDTRWPVVASDGDTRSPEGFWRKKAVKSTTDLLCWRDELVWGLSAANAQKAVDGDCEGVLYGFEWEASPQGGRYWYELHKAMRLGEPLPDEARDILLASIAVAKREAEAKPAETPETTEPVKQPIVHILVSVPLDRVAELHAVAAGLCGECTTNE